MVSPGAVYVVEFQKLPESCPHGSQFKPESNIGNKVGTREWGIHETIARTAELAVRSPK